MPSKQIDRDEFETVLSELENPTETRIGDVVTITGRHEDHGEVRLRREAGVFTVEASDTSLVRDRGVAREE